MNNTSLQKSQVLLFLVLTKLLGSRHRTVTVGNPGTRTKPWLCQALPVQCPSHGMPPDPAGDKSSDMAGQGVKVNDEDRDISLQDRLHCSRGGIPTSIRPWAEKGSSHTHFSTECHYKRSPQARGTSFPHAQAVPGDTTQHTGQQNVKSSN